MARNLSVCLTVMLDAHRHLGGNPPVGAGPGPPAGGSSRKAQSSPDSSWSVRQGRAGQGRG